MVPTLRCGMHTQHSAKVFVDGLPLVKWRPSTMVTTSTREGARASAPKTEIQHFLLTLSYLYSCVSTHPNIVWSLYMFARTPSLSQNARRMRASVLTLSTNAVVWYLHTGHKTLKWSLLLFFLLQVCCLCTVCSALCLRSARDPIKTHKHWQSPPSLEFEKTLDKIAACGHKTMSASAELWQEHEHGGGGTVSSTLS